MNRTLPWPRRAAASLGAATLLLLLSPGCATTPEPLYAGAESQPHSEHVFLYPLPEALAAVRAVLAEHDYDSEPFGDGNQLLTRWRLDGRSMSGYTNTTYLRRYYVQGIAVGRYRSVVRIFRIDRQEPYTPGQMPSELVYTAMLAPKERKKAKAQEEADGSSEDAASGGWRHYVAAGMETDQRMLVDKADTDGLEQREKRSVATAGGRGTNYLGGPTRQLMADPRFADQYTMSSQDELQGANERGVRDRDVEKELVERLEQFASLEFTGGAYDVPRAPGAPGEPPVTLEWEREDGGMPFRGPGPCGQPIIGLGPLSAPGSTVLVGEQLGTREVPAAVGNMACELAQVGRRVLLGLPLPREEQGALDTYVRSAGQYGDLSELLAGSFWRQVPRDGRSSRALVLLLERVRRWRAAGLDIEPIAYDASDTKGNTREEAMAGVLLAHRKASPQATLLVLGGNYHVRSVDGAPWSRRFQPLGYRLAQKGIPHVSLDTAFARGQRWACSVNRRHEPECRVYATSPSKDSYSAPGRAPSVQLFDKTSQAGFHGVLHVGALTASIPALLPRATLASAASAVQQPKPPQGPAPSSP